MGLTKSVEQLTPAQTEAHELALVRSSEMEADRLAALAVELSEDEKDAAAIALRAAGATYTTITNSLGLTPNHIKNLMKRDETRKIMQIVRDAAKMEAVVQGFVLQRKYLDALEAMPVDARHAGAHASIVKAFSTLFDKAALAAGEATDRTETRTIAITLDAKKELLDALLEAQETRLDREAIAAKFEVVASGRD